jgi:hypothetical protein
LAVAEGGRLYLLAVIGGTREAVEGPDAEYFLGSFRLGPPGKELNPPVNPPEKTPPPPQPEPSPALKYQTFRDPTFDRSFTAQVPAGWKVRGGTVRPPGIRLLTTFQVKAQSPDGQITISLDVNAPPKVQLLEWPPYLPKGMTRLPITGVGQVPIADYRPGAEYLSAYALSPAGHEGLRVAPRQWPELGEALSRVPGFEQVDVGEAAYTFRRDGRAYRGAAFVVTRIYDSGPGAPILWHCLWLASYEAPQAREREAKAALMRLVGTWRLDPAWVARMERAQRASMESLMQAGQYTARVTSEAYWQRAKTYAGIFRGDAQARRGTVELRDPRTGQDYTMPNTWEYYWIRPNGERIGTRDNTPPAHDAEPLIILDVKQEGTP